MYTLANYKLNQLNSYIKCLCGRMKFTAFTLLTNKTNQKGHAIFQLIIINKLISIKIVLHK